MNIRTVKPDDFPALVVLWQEFMDFHIDSNSFYIRSSDGHEQWLKFVQGRMNDSDFLLRMAFIDEKPVGYCMASIMEYPPVFTVKKYGFISDMAVTSSARREGVAGALFNQARSWFQEKGISKIELKVDAFNNTSQGFWKEMGFSPHTETWARPVDDCVAKTQPPES